MADPNQRCGEQLLDENNAVAAFPRCDTYGAAVNGESLGRHFEDNAKGRLFSFTTLTPAALLLAATTGNCPTIWNPSDSGKIFIPTNVSLAFVSGTTTIGSVLWAVTAAQAGQLVVATVGPIITFTKVTPASNSLGDPKAKASGMLWAPAVCTFVAIPTIVKPTGINLGAAWPTNCGGLIDAPQDGRLILWPGQALSLVYSVTTSTALVFATIEGIVKPLPKYL